MNKVAMYTTSKLFGPRSTGGLKRYLELYNGLKKRGIEVDLFCSDSQEELRQNGVSAYSLKNTREHKSFLIPTEFNILTKNIGLIKKIKKDNYSSIIVFDVPTAIGLCLLGVKHIQLFIRQDLIAYKELSIKEKTKNKFIIKTYLELMRICESICLIKSERIITQCKYDYESIVKRHRLIEKVIEKKSKIQINNANPSWIVEKSKLSSGNVRNHISIETKNKFLVGFIGDFSNDRKGHRIFIQAIIQLLEKETDIEAIVVGDGRQLTEYKKRCNDYPQIQFTGRLKNPIDIIKKCNLIVVPSLADSCPNTVMESLYNEVPVIGAFSGGIPEILIDKEFLFELNPNSLMSKIELYLDKDNLRDLTTKQMLRKRELLFDWVDTIMTILELEE